MFVIGTDKALFRVSRRRCGFFFTCLAWIKGPFVYELHQALFHVCPLEIVICSMSLASTKGPFVYKIHWYKSPLYIKKSPSSVYFVCTDEFILLFFEGKSPKTMHISLTCMWLTNAAAHCNMVHTGTHCNILHRTASHLQHQRHRRMAAGAGTGRVCANLRIWVLKGL